MRSIALLCSILPLLAGCDGGVAKVVRPAPLIRPEPAMVHAHSHNDYENRWPLELALSNGFHSVEADIWLISGRLQVSHGGRQIAGELESLYLMPLARRARELGSVYGDQRRFLLWLDLKEQGAEFIEAVASLVRRYRSDFEVGNIVVVLTGDDDTKRRLVGEYAMPHVMRDSNEFSPLHPKANDRWLWYALDWEDHFGWAGRGSMGSEERSRLEAMLEVIHTRGRKVRFYNTPDTVDYWRLAMATGIDLINTDRVEDLAAFLRSQ